jgi:transcriptional regulator with XRE-family HTH domain
MSAKCISDYQSARLAAGLTQEAAAEQLAISVRSLAEYEAGRIVPAPDIVCSMVDLYDTPLLGIRHVCKQYPFLRRYLPVEEPRQLPEAVMHLVGRFYDFSDQHPDRRLLRIAEDGVIDDAERPEYEAIMDELTEIVRAALLVDRAPKAKKGPPFGCNQMKGKCKG